jgi:hypothetical protein
MLPSTSLVLSSTAHVLQNFLEIYKASGKKQDFIYFGEYVGSTRGVQGSMREVREEYREVRKE